MAKNNLYKGYSKFAEFFGYHPGTAIVRRFAPLNAKLLLYRQAELSQLELDLESLEADESETNGVDGKPILSAVDLMRSGGSHKVKAKLAELGEKLHQYNEHLFQISELYKLPKPNEYDLWFLRAWLENENYGGNFLVGCERRVWEGQSRDLIALSTRGQDGDIFTRWMAECISPFLSSLFQRHRPRDEEAEDEEQQAVDQQIDASLRVYEGRRVRQVTSFITVIFASLLPTASIFALNAITVQYARLGFIMGFSAIFSACLVTFTQARRVEIFTAAVALASVQVVFIGTN